MERSHTLGSTGTDGMAVEEELDPSTPMDALLAPLLKELGDPQEPPSRHEPPSPGPAGGSAGSLAEPGGGAPPQVGTLAGLQLRGMGEPELLAQLLMCLETGQIHRDVMEQFHLQNRDPEVAQELTGILYAIDLLDTHRLRLVELLRTLHGAP